MGATRYTSDTIEPPTGQIPQESAPVSSIPPACSFDSPKALSLAFAVASHDVLFEAAGVKPESVCDVCGETVDEDDEDEGHAVAGHGLYVWTRGEETRRDEPPLCPSCAVALGLSALARWETDEEEG